VCQKFPAKSLESTTSDLDKNLNIPPSNGVKNPIENQNMAKHNEVGAAYIMWA
jgi:hypothetical protein